MDPMTIGIAAGLGKSLLFDAPKAERERQLAATTATLSPWTGMQPTMPQEADMLGSALQGGMAGAAFGQANPGFNAVKTPALNPADQGVVNSAVGDMGDQISSQSISPMNPRPQAMMSNKKKSSWDLMPGQMLG